MPEWQLNLIFVTLTQTLATLTINNVAPFLPFFISELGVEDAYVAFWSGLLISINGLFAGLMSPVWGRLSDRFSHKMMILRSTVAIALFTILTSFATNVYHVLIFRMLLGAFSGFSSIALAFIAKQAPEHRLGFAIGWLQTGQVLGFVVGPLLGGFLADLFPYRQVYRIASLMAITATIIAITCIKDIPKPAQERRPKEKTNPRRLLGWPLIIWVMFSVILISQFATRTVEPLMPLYVKKIVGEAKNLNTISGLVIAVMGLTQVVTVTILGRHAYSWGYKRCLLYCLAGTAAFCLPQAFVTQAWQLVLLRICQGLFLGGLLPMANSLIGISTPPEQRGSVYGLTQAAFYFGNFLGPLFGGAQGGWLGIETVFFTASGLLLLNFLWVLTKVYEPKREVKGASKA